MRSILRPLCLLGVAALGFSACDEDPADSDASTCTTAGPVVEILDNHLETGGDHYFEVPADDVVEAELKVYDIRGDNVGHTHSVTIGSDDFLSLQEDKTITILSSNNGPIGTGHDHTIRLSCP